MCVCVCVCVCVREREREGERERERERELELGTRKVCFTRIVERERQRQTDRQTDRAITVTVNRSGLPPCGRWAPYKSPCIISIT